MADELRYSIKIIPVIDNEGGSDGELSSKNIDTRGKIVGHVMSLYSSGEGPVTDTIPNTPAYVDGILQHISSNGADGTESIHCTGSPNGVWYKNTGFRYDASKEGNIDRSIKESTGVIIFSSSVINTAYDICTLQPGVGFFIPAPITTQMSINDNEVGEPVAVECLIFT